MPPLVPVCHITQLFHRHPLQSSRVGATASCVSRRLFHHPPASLEAPPLAQIEAFSRIGKAALLGIRRIDVEVLMKVRRGPLAEGRELLEGGRDLVVRIRRRCRCNAATGGLSEDGVGPTGGSPRRAELQVNGHEYGIIRVRVWKAQLELT